jgi:uncharacterized protein (TIGR02145 family)
MKLETGSLLANRYRLLEQLGYGGFSEVWKAEDTLVKDIIALKIFVPGTGLDTRGIEMFSHEFKLLRHIHHPNLLRAEHFGVYNRRPYLEVEYMPNQSCKNRIGEFKERDVPRFLLQVAGALDYLLGQDPPVLHLDIKPENILIDVKLNFRLADFGISTLFRQTLSKHSGTDIRNAGTGPYMPPECFEKDISRRLVSPARDIFSLGITLFELLTGELPFGELGGIALISGAPVPDLPVNFSPGLNRLVKSCLSRVPSVRPTAHQLIKAAENYTATGKWIEDLDNEQPQMTTTQTKTDQNTTQPLYDEAESANIRKAASTSKKTKRPLMAGLIILIMLITAYSIYRITDYWHRNETSTAGPETSESHVVVIPKDTLSSDQNQEIVVPAKLPVVVTARVNKITSTSAVCGGKIMADGGSKISESGIYISIHQTIEYHREGAIKGIAIPPKKFHIQTIQNGIFDTCITGLEPNTEYTVTAYAVNQFGTGYGEEVKFISLPKPENNPDKSEKVSLKPADFEVEISNVTSNSASAGVMITPNPAKILFCGICWSAKAEPTIADNNKMFPAWGKIHKFNFYIENLKSNTVYHARAFAITREDTVYGETIPFITLLYYEVGSVTDIDGNTYRTVIIGSQEWMAENLRVTHFNDGSEINNLSNYRHKQLPYGDSLKLYKVDTLNKIDKQEYFKSGYHENKYGKLYNYDAVKQGLCPEGWHVPEDYEWDVLIGYLGGDKIAGGRLKEADTLHWASPNTGATNFSGFSALPGGMYKDGRLFDLYKKAYFYSSYRRAIILSSDSEVIGDNMIINKKKYWTNDIGMSVRCLKN